MQSAEALPSSVGAAVPNRILLIRLGAVGDVVRTRFAFQGVRELFPASRIDWLVDDRAAAALDGIVGLGDVVVVRRSSRLGALRALPGSIRELRGRRYDLLVDFHGVFRSALLALLSRTPDRVGFARPVAREWSHLAYTRRVSLAKDHVSRFERNAALVRALGGDVPLRPPPLEIPRSVQTAYAEVPRDRFVLHPGTSAGTRYKRWPAERWADVAVRLREEVGTASLVTWGRVAGERDEALEVVHRADGAAELAPPTPTVAHLLEILRRSRAFIGGDSGPLHLAALAGRPLVALLGPTDPIENAPFAGVPSRVVRRDVGCNPCREGCRARSCMTAIGVEAAVAAALGLVAGPAPLQ